MEKIDKINEEEVAFGYETTQYPLRKQVHDKLGPYKKLYDNCSDYLAKHELWMNSRVR